MAKNVLDDVRFRSAQSGGPSGGRGSTVGRSVLNFRKTYSQDDLDNIELERAAMRQRLTSGD